MGGFDEEMTARHEFFKDIVHNQYRGFLEDNGIKHLSDIEKVFSFMMDQFALALVNFEAVTMGFIKVTQDIEGIKKQLPIGDYNGEH
jgi:hypothetical protein